MSPAAYTTVFIVACGFLLLAPTLATPPLPPATIFPLPPLFGQDPDFQKCLTTIGAVQGCLQEVITSFLSFQFPLIGPSCCKALMEIDEKCLPKILPDPFFVILLKNYCTTVVVRPAQPPASPPVTAARKVIENRNN